MNTFYFELLLTKIPKKTYLKIEPCAVSHTFRAAKPLECSLNEIKWFLLNEGMVSV